MKTEDTQVRKSLFFEEECCFVGENGSCGTELSEVVVLWGLKFHGFLSSL